MSIYFAMHVAPFLLFFATSDSISVLTFQRFRHAMSFLLGSFVEFDKTWKLSTQLYDTNRTPFCQC